LEIRNPNKSHYPDIVALLHCCFQPAWEPQTLIDRVYFEPHYDPNHVWMAREAGQMLGFMVTTLVEDRAWLKLIAVDPTHRRKGLARDLLSRAEFRLEGEGAKQMLVESTPPFEFLPGVEPGSAGESLFKAQGYEAKEFKAQWVSPSGGAEGKAFDKAAAAQFASRVSGEAWPWVEENIGTLPPRLVFEPGVGLALADPGQSVGPFWLDAGAPAGALESLSRAAVAIARIECHYFMNGAFFKSDNWLIENIDKMRKMTSPDLPFYSWVLSSSQSVPVDVPGEWKSASAEPT
jgi:GNAT superfamily N-acetyltransferase